VVDAQDLASDGGLFAGLSGLLSDGMNDDGTTVYLNLGGALQISDLGVDSIGFDLRNNDSGLLGGDGRLDTVDYQVVGVVQHTDIAGVQSFSDFDSDGNGTVYLNAGLDELRDLGIDSVISADLGLVDGVALTGGLGTLGLQGANISAAPKFGDLDQNGSISSTEDEALDVAVILKSGDFDNLSWLSSASEPDEADRFFASLAAIGIDELRFDLATAPTVSESGTISYAELQVLANSYNDGQTDVLLRVEVKPIGHNDIT